MTLDPKAAAFLKKKGMTLAQWHTFTKNRAVSKSNSTSTTTRTHPQIANSLADYITLHNKLFNPADEAAWAHAFADSQVTPVSTLQAQADNRQGVISNVGAELLKSLAGIQTAGVDAVNGGVKTFTGGATAADAAAAGQAAAAGGVVAPSTTGTNADSLSRLGANTNNILAGQQAGAAKNNALYGRQTESDLQTAIKNRNDDVTKLAAQEFEAKQARDSTDLSNLLTYNLYNVEDTNKTTVAKSTIALNRSIAHEKAAAKVIDQGIAKRKNEIAAMLANGTLTKQQADKLSKMYKAVEDVYNHQLSGDSAGTGGKGWKLVVTEQAQVPDTTGGAAGDGKGPHGEQLYKTVSKNRTLNVTDAQYQNFLKSGPQGSRKLALLGAQPGARLVPGSIAQTTGGTGATGSKWTPLQSKQVLMAAGFPPDQVAAIIKTLSQAGTPAGKAAAQTLLAKLPVWLKTGIPAANPPFPGAAPAPVTYTPGG